jgi:hypothetical protein
MVREVQLPLLLQFELETLFKHLTNACHWSQKLSKEIWGSLWIHYSNLENDMKSYCVRHNRIIFMYQYRQCYSYIITFIGKCERKIKCWKYDKKFKCTSENRIIKPTFLKRKKRIRKSHKGSEFNQSTLYTCIEISQCAFNVC